MYRYAVEICERVDPRVVSMQQLDNITAPARKALAIAATQAEREEIIKYEENIVLGDGRSTR